MLGRYKIDLEWIQKIIYVYLQKHNNKIMT